MVDMFGGFSLWKNKERHVRMRKCQRSNSIEQESGKEMAIQPISNNKVVDISASLPLKDTERDRQEKGKKDVISREARVRNNHCNLHWIRWLTSLPTIFWMKEGKTSEDKKLKWVTVRTRGKKKKERKKQREKETERKAMQPALNGTVDISSTSFALKKERNEWEQCTERWVMKKWAKKREISMSE